MRHVEGGGGPAFVFVTSFGEVQMSHDPPLGIMCHEGDGQSSTGERHKLG